MTFLRRADFEELFETHGFPCVSIYLPTLGVGPQVRQTVALFKSLLGQAQRDIQANGIEGQQLERLLEPARELVYDARFWAHPGEGLAIFLARGYFNHFRTAHSVEPLATVHGRFHLQPLLAQTGGWPRFYILALDPSRIRLLEAGPDGLRPIGLRCHTSLPGDLVRLAETGLPAEAPQEHEQLLALLQEISTAACEALAGRHAPLVSAGTGCLIGLYRRINAYPYLADEAVYGTSKEPVPEDALLVEQALDAVQPFVDRNRDEILGLYHELAGTGLSSDRIEEVLRAAHAGRVRAMVVARQASIGGRFDPSEDAVEVTGHPDHEDLVDRTIMEVLDNGGQVYLAERGALPGKASVAAVFRY